jgi:uncharacterized heparinase superfamily protein
MNHVKLQLLFETLRHVKPRQVIYRGYYFVRKRIGSQALPSLTGAPEGKRLGLVSPIFRNRSMAGTAFTFLNRAHDFRDQIDWNFPEYGKLWCYNLNYFDFLNQEGMEKETGAALTSDFMEQAGPGSVGWEPYPTSLRIINWIKFICRHDIRDRSIDESLYHQALHLCRNLEYHLLGNHLLENGFALLIAACHFDDAQLHAKARKILEAELAEQLLPDGGHFELSAMYHQILLDRLLDCINILGSAGPDNDLLKFLRQKASAMLGWLGRMTFRNGDIPLVNDAAFGIAPTTAELMAYAERLGVPTMTRPLRESGYRKIDRGTYELLLDVGNIGPDYIPGHAHSDTFSFVLYRDGRPLIVDTGTSTYETCDRRLVERRTAAHNTVQMDGREQSEVWGSFRVARRAYVRNLKESEDSISAWHTGYERIGARHAREFAFSDREIVIRDTVTSRKDHACRAFLHFHPDVQVTLEADRVVADDISVTFSGAAEIALDEYLYAPQFNVLVPGKVVIVSFSLELVTTIKAKAM